ncbi:FAS1-like dehydratase domain-containing protein [Rhodococcus opacus]|uniref:Acyl dehydratase n=1 Tax=Rhodococcus opacus TaxID=37919 RepID=A0A076F0H2_RHOOP|nr:MaoC family dehydratase N-terminal domain-containing protein [Rhodococcus opacus]AII10927.1 acyl dehydratase [Rhodococcus opacus]
MTAGTAEPTTDATNVAASETEARMPEAVIDQTMIANMEAKVGAELRIDHSVNNEEATRIAVAKFAGGIGDVNTLWTDAEYARRSDYGAPVAPPTFSIGCFSGIQFGWPGLGAFHCATQMDIAAPIYWNDTVTSSCRYDGFTGPRPSNFAGRMVTDSFTNEYINQLGEKVAEIRWQVVNYERGAARGKGKSRKIEVPHRWTVEEVEEVERKVLSEKPRGEVPLWWEDVEVGDALSSLTKGPIGLTDEVAFVAGGGAPIPRLKANASAALDYDSHPAWAFRDPVTKAKEPIYSVHYNQAAANAMGVAYQYDVGFQRQCWQILALSNWCGDNAWVKHVSAEYRGFVYLGDVIELGGEVTGKSQDDDGEYVVEVTTFARNQRGDNVMPGKGIIALPSRSDSISPVARRARAAESIRSRV